MEVNSVSNKKDDKGLAINTAKITMDDNSGFVARECGMEDAWTTMQLRDISVDVQIVWAKHVEINNETFLLVRAGEVVGFTTEPGNALYVLAAHSSRVVGIIAATPVDIEKAVEVAAAFRAKMSN